MKHWRIIVKTHDYRPTEGTYSNWKPHLRKESECRCVYCSIHDARFGGQRNFHVEHFKPKENKKFPEFADLRDNYDNLYYACAVCNTFKSNSWFDVKEADWESKHFPDPAVFDYCEFFEIDEYFLIVGNHFVGKFLVERFHLNREHLIRERKLEYINTSVVEKIEKLNSIFEKIRIINSQNGDNANLREVLNLQSEFNTIQTKYIKLSQFPFENSIYTHGELS